TVNCIVGKEPPYAERHVRWCERSENESRKKTTSFSSYSIDSCKYKTHTILGGEMKKNAIKRTSWI
ncbi:MAG: hypothetical protein LBV41_01850, partial [Cytophagaceae bacterium]|nr:hypothetical protein [Cytophagaceae bacterium]